MTHRTKERQGEPEIGESATGGEEPAALTAAANGRNLNVTPAGESSRAKKRRRPEGPYEHELRCQQRSLQEFS